MVTLEERVAKVEQGQDAVLGILQQHTAILQQHSETLQHLRSDVSVARAEIQVLARFLKRRLDPDGQDDDPDIYELTKERL